MANLDGQMMKTKAMPGREAFKTTFERDEQAERDLLEEMVSYSKKITGVDNTVFISAKGFTRHAPRIKVAIDPPDSFDPRGETASIMIDDGKVVDGEVVDGEVPKKLLEQVREFVKLNRGVLLDYWDYKINTEQLQERLKARAC